MFRTLLPVHPPTLAMRWAESRWSPEAAPQVPLAVLPVAAEQRRLRPLAALGPCGGAGVRGAVERRAAGQRARDGRKHPALDAGRLVVVQPGRHDVRQHLAHVRFKRGRV